MVTMGVLYLCLFCAMIPSIIAGGGSCYAPPLFYGGLCSSSTSVFGSPGYKIKYTIDQVNNAGTEICCKARACGPLFSRQCTTWGLYDIGCSATSIIAIVPWGNNVATPAIKCKGIPFGTSLSWSH